MNQLARNISKFLFAALVCVSINIKAGLCDQLSPNSLTDEQASFKKPSMVQIKSKLTAEQFAVTQEGATERAFNNPYWDNHEDGIYVDVVTGEPLFSSKDKYDSGTGWPSFSKPLNDEAVSLNEDKSFWFQSRTEVRSHIGDSHLGHVFDDGPPSTGKRYCINSAALRFIPAEKLASEGYSKYSELFSPKERQD